MNRFITATLLLLIPAGNLMAATGASSSFGKSTDSFSSPTPAPTPRKIPVVPAPIPKHQKMQQTVKLNQTIKPNGQAPTIIAIYRGPGRFDKALFAANTSSTVPLDTSPVIEDAPKEKTTITAPAPTKMTAPTPNITAPNSAKVPFPIVPVIRPLPGLVPMPGTSDNNNGNKALPPPLLTPLN